MIPRLPVLYICLSVLFAGMVAKADIIDFETQGAAAPAAFIGVLNSPLAIGIATFTGGELLNHAAGGVDQTAVYATTNASPSGGAYLDPLTITFSQAVSGFSLDVTNEFADTYIIADNKGGSQSSAVTLNTTHNFSLSDSGITSVTVSSTSKAFWDFAIDNVSFTPAAAVPEPSPLLILALALGTLVVLARRKLA